MAERCPLYQNNSEASPTSPERGLHTGCHIGSSALVPLQSSLALKGSTKPCLWLWCQTWCGNQDRVHACMTISLRPDHILSDLMAMYADKEITQQNILRCSLDMCNGRGPYKIWLIASTDNSQVFWVLSAVCSVGSNLGLFRPLTGPAGRQHLSVSTLFYWLLIPLQNVKAFTFWSQSVN